MSKTVHADHVKGWKLFVGLCVAIGGILLVWLSLIGVRVGVKLSADSLQPETGFAFVTHLRPALPRFLLLKGDTPQSPRSSTSLLLENDMPIGVAHSGHEDIRKRGRGRYSHWGDWLYFSTSDNSDPRSNRRSYAVLVTVSLHPLLGIVASLALGAVIIWIRDELRALLESASERFIPAWMIHGFREIMLALIIALCSMALAFGVAEIYFRWTRPFKEIKWPSRFVPEVGFLFEPNAELRYTNEIDFWVEERTNSLGFLDREPPFPTEMNGCRIAFIGDSFVEAAQVHNREKVQALLESITQMKRPEWNLAAAGFGFSGTGQMNQIPFYDRFVRVMHPNLVVLVFTGNDFANNSFILESLRNGWYPDHTPRLFARRDSVTNRLSLMPIDPTWRDYLMQDDALGMPRSGTAYITHAWAKENSYFYSWVWKKLTLLWPTGVNRFDRPVLEELMVQRARYLKRIDRYQEYFRDWDDRFAARLDEMFAQRELPRLFSDAIDLTRFALSEFKSRVERDGAQLALLTPSQLSIVKKRTNTVALERLKAMAADLNIPVMDQYEFIVRYKKDPSTAHFRHDGHWTPDGHRWAAELVFEFLSARPQICSMRMSSIKNF